MREYIRTFKFGLLLTVAGLVGGFMIERQHDAFFDTLFDAPLVANMMARAYCGQPDERGKLMIVRCADNIAIWEIRNRDIEHDQALAPFAASEEQYTNLKAVKRKKP